MNIKVEQFWQDLGEVEQRVHEHLKEVLTVLRESSQKNVIKGFTLMHEGVEVRITGITEDICLDTNEVGLEELLGMHIYTVESFDVYELLLLLRHLKDNVETNLNARMEDEGSIES